MRLAQLKLFKDDYKSIMSGKVSEKKIKSKDDNKKKNQEDFNIIENE